MVHRGSLPRAAGAPTRTHKHSAFETIAACHPVPHWSPATAHPLEVCVLQFDEVAEGSLAHMLQRATSVLPSRQETAFVKAQLEKLRALATQPQSQQTSQEMVKAANAALSRLNRLKPE